MKKLFKKLDQIIEILEEYKGKDLCVICNEWQATFSKANVYSYKITDGMTKSDRSLTVYEGDKEFFSINEQWLELPTEAELEMAMKKSKDTIVGCTWRLTNMSAGMTDILLIQCFRVKDIYMMKQRAGDSRFNLQDYWKGIALLITNPSALEFCKN